MNCSDMKHKQSADQNTSGICATMSTYMLCPTASPDAPSCHDNINSINPDYQVSVVGQERLNKILLGFVL